MKIIIKNAYIGFYSLFLHYNCLYYDKDNISSVKGSFLTKLTGY